jgi:ABC-type transport system involved in multi-copper enzyme maturation permease subunit
MFAVIWSSFYETIRQKAYGLLLSLGALCIISSPAFALFTLSQGPKLVQDMGLATIMLVGLLMAALSADSAISQELEGRTAITVLSKPISRETFLLSKYIGLALAVLWAQYILMHILILTYRFGVKDTASTKLEWVALCVALGAALIACALSGLLNYFFDKPFISTTIIISGALLTFAFPMFLIYSFDHDTGKYTVQGFGKGINWAIPLCSLLIAQAVCILLAIAVALSTRLKTATTLSLCGAFFIAGLVSDYFLGAAAKLNPFAKFIYSIIPNLQVFWLSEALVKDKQIPFDYIVYCTIYSSFFILSVLFFGMFLFKRREICE